MVDTFQAIAVTVVALLPGGLYMWGFEGQVGLWGVRLVDRLLRFFGYSAGFQALLSPATYWFYANYVHTGRLAAGAPLPLWLWAAAIAYVVVPFLSGRLVGTGVHRRWRWALFLVGKDPAPRAWDDVFGGRPVAWIRMKLKSGSWVGGAFAVDRHGRGSYAAGYPEQQDPYLSEQAEVDPETGDLLVDAQGKVKLLDRGLLIRWDEVEYLVFQEAQKARHPVNSRERALMDADKAAQPASSGVDRPDDVKRGGYGSGRTPATELAPPSTGVKPDGGSGDSESSGSKE